MVAVPLIQDKDDQAKKQGIKIIESMQIREQNIKKRLGNTGARHQGNDIELEILGVFQALSNEIGKQRERQCAQGSHDKFMFREKEYGRMVNHHCHKSNQFNHFDDPKLKVYEISLKTQKEKAIVTMGNPT